MKTIGDKLCATRSSTGDATDEMEAINLFSWRLMAGGVSVLAARLGWLVVWGGLTVSDIAVAGAGTAVEFRDFYFPNTEVLAPDELRVIALGTGTPHIRPAQAATSWLVELGNGDKLLFDVGTGSLRSLAGLQIPYDELAKIFISHLHVDHVGDFDALWASGWTGGRLGQLRVWGPSGPESNLGTRHYIEKLQDAMHWDYATRIGELPESGSRIEINEFDYSKSQVVYQENGATVTSFPAVHILDGAVSYRLDWKGMSFVFSGDTTPNKWMLEQASQVDLLVHEVYMTTDQLMNRFGWDGKMAMSISRHVHTTPAAAGEIFHRTNPRMAVAYHFYNDSDIAPAIEHDIRKYYSGKLVFADDLMVFNVTKDEIKVRHAVTPERTWPKIGDREKFAKAKRGESRAMSKWLDEGQLDIDIYAGDE